MIIYLERMGRSSIKKMDSSYLKIVMSDEYQIHSMRFNEILNRIKSYRKDDKYRFLHSVQLQLDIIHPTKIRMNIITDYMEVNYEFKTMVLSLFDEFKNALTYFESVVDKFPKDDSLREQIAVGHYFISELPIMEHAMYEIIEISLVLKWNSKILNFATKTLDDVSLFSENEEYRKRLKDLCVIKRLTDD